MYWDSNLVSRMRENIMSDLLDDNLALVVPRQCVDDWKYALISNIIGEHNFTGTAGPFGAGSFFPLYIYHPDGTRTANFAPAELSALTRQLSGEPSPEDVLDYIYAVLHSPSYRAKYKEFLKIDFPRVPAPTQAEFDRLVPLGRQLRQLHLMKSPAVDDFITTYPVAGDNVVEKPRFVPDTTSSVDATSGGSDAISSVSGRVYINDTQYFGSVPQLAWEFYIGGYQPAQKWLKDRKGRTLTMQDIAHYQRIIRILCETDKIMADIR